MRRPLPEKGVRPTAILGRTHAAESGCGKGLLTTLSSEYGHSNHHQGQYK